MKPAHSRGSKPPCADSVRFIGSGLLAGGRKRNDPAATRRRSAGERGRTFLVPGARLELARGYPYAPQTYVSTSSTTRARDRGPPVPTLRGSGPERALRA